MRLAFICTDRGPCPPVKGGAIQLLITKVAPLLAKKHKVTVFSITDPDLALQEMTDQVVYERFEKSQYLHQVCMRVREKQFDIIQVYNRPGWVSFLRDAAPEAKLILSLHNLIYNTIKVEQEQAVRGITEANRIVTVSRFVAEDTAKKFPDAAGKIQVLYTGADVNDYAPVWTKKGRDWRKLIRNRYQIAHHDKVLLFVGRLVPEKGCHLILETMKESLKSYEKVKLLIVGSKWYADQSTSAYINKLRSMAEALSKRIIFTSYVSVEEIPKYFAAADMFICPSQWQEPLARVHYEAMAAGLPIITTKRGGNHELFQKDTDGIVVTEYQDSKAFGQAITTLLENPELAGKMGRHGRIKAEETYNFERVAADLEKIYAELAAVNE